MYQVLPVTRYSSNEHLLPCSPDIGRVEFTKQPPSNLRKSNFFNFMVRFYDGNGSPVEVERTSFIKFIDEVSWKVMIFTCGQPTGRPQV